MKLTIILSAAAISLAGCAVVPAGPGYGYGYGYGYDGPAVYGPPVVVAPSIGFYGRWYGGNRGWGGHWH